MRLEELARQIGASAVAGSLDGDVRDVTHDSRQCSPGVVFVAIKGEKSDGNDFVSQATGLGAVAIVSEQPPRPGMRWIQVADSRIALARAAAAVHGHPSTRLKLVGVTGTNGKTTTAHLVDYVIRVAEGSSALFGTIGHRIGARSTAAGHTTPESSDLQRLLREAVDAGCRSAVMEVSSHAIELHRVDALHFEVAVFTNLTRDHLDYHTTMENYFAAKSKLFDGSLGVPPRVSVVNVDDEYGDRLRGIAAGGVMTYGFASQAEVRTSSFTVTSGGLRFAVDTPAGTTELTSRLVGRPHVYNALAATAAGLALGFDLTTVARGIAECPAVPGRFEVVTIAADPPPEYSVIVDYAHTDDALKNVLLTAREIAGNGRVILVFGCGGDRDRTKRAPMGELAGRLADVAIVTSDNPRTEDPLAIIADIEVGLGRSGRPYVTLPDRRQAIFLAVSEARAGDVVLIAGKGHETYQIVGSQRTHFDDREVAAAAMAAKPTGGK